MVLLGDQELSREHRGYRMSLWWCLYDDISSRMMDTRHHLMIRKGLKHQDILCPTNNSMDDSECERLMEAVDRGDELESLSILGNVLDKVIEEMTRHVGEGDMLSVSRRIETERGIYDAGRSVYEKMSGGSMSEKRESVGEFVRMVREYYGKRDETMCEEDK